MACRPPTYTLLTVGGMNVTALPHQVMVLEQKCLRDNRPAQIQQPDAGTSQSDVSEQQNPYFVQSTASQPSPTPPPPTPPPPTVDPPSSQQQRRNAGERPGSTSTSGYSDMSLALLHNTAALEGNLAAAQHGADIDISAEADELSHMAADMTHAAHQKGRMPDTTVSSPGAHSAQVHLELACVCLTDYLQHSSKASCSPQYADSALELTVMYRAGSAGSPPVQQAAPLRFNTQSDTGMTCHIGGTIRYLPWLNQSSLACESVTLLT